MSLVRRAAVIATGWVGDTLACSAVASSLAEERGFVVDFYIKWPQIQRLLQFDSNFNTIIYNDTRYGRFKLWKSVHEGYELIVKEPSKWSHEEPFTSEIRRMAGCNPKPDFSLPIGDYFRNTNQQIKSLKPRVIISRDLYIRGLGRDIDEFVNMLTPLVDIIWVGLPSGKNSKKGKKNDLYEDAMTICSGDCFVGPEGGLLWLAGALGQKTIYFTERIKQAADVLQRGDSFKAVGNINIFPDKAHSALPLNCTNEYAVNYIVSSLTENNS